MESRLHQLRQRLEKHGQEHSLQFVHQLSDLEKQHLVEDLESIDLDEFRELHKTAKEKILEPVGISAQREVRPFGDVYTLEGTIAERAELESEGLAALVQGKVAMLLLAGGQGTRLGSDQPKGMYDIGLPSHKSLYQLQAERLLGTERIAAMRNSGSSRSADPDAAQKRPRVVEGAGFIPWYIMLSGATGDQTEQFFEKNNYWGLKKEQVFFFRQPMMPTMDPNGKIIMESKSAVSRAPNGNGALYAALKSSGALADMKRRGIELVYQYCVDNALIKMADPVMVGYFLRHPEADVCTKVCQKRSADEPVGVLGLVDGKPRVIEYSEIDPQMARQTGADGRLLFNSAHLCMNMYRVSFLESLTRQIPKLPYHVAAKKIPAVTATGDTETPTSPNGWKLEMFIFDVFPLARKMVAFECERLEEFSPLKNAKGTKKDSPETCRWDVSELHKRWLESSGGRLLPPVRPRSDDDHLLEISPLISVNGENLTQFNGQAFQLPALIGLAQ